jgi:hypothetical protein
MALDFGPNARYEGFDIMPDGIDYCSSKDTPVFPHIPLPSRGSLQFALQGIRRELPAPQQDRSGLQACAA